MCGTGGLERGTGGLEGGTGSLGGETGGLGGGTGSLQVEQEVWEVEQEVWKVGQAVCRWNKSGRRDRRSTVGSAAVSGPWSSAGCSKLPRAGVSAFSLFPP